MDSTPYTSMQFLRGNQLQPKSKPCMLQLYPTLTEYTTSKYKFSI